MRLGQWLIRFMKWPTQYMKQRYSITASLGSWDLSSTVIASPYYTFPYHFLSSVFCVLLGMDRIYEEVLSVVAVNLQAGSLTFNFEPFLDSILAEDLGSAGE